MLTWQITDLLFDRTVFRPRGMPYTCKYTLDPRLETRFPSQEASGTQLSELHNGTLTLSRLL